MSDVQGNYGTVVFHRLKYTKAALERAPKDEAIAYLMAAQLHNDIASLLKIVLQNPVRDGEPEPVRHAASIMQLTALRLLAGRTTEGWQLIEGIFQKYLREYLGSRSRPSRGGAALDWLKSYFGSTNVLRQIRNKTSFHADRDVFEAAFDLVSSDQELHDFHQDSVGNTLYFGADLILTQGIIGLAPDEEPTDALLRVIGDVKEASGKMLDVTGAYVFGFCERWLSEELQRLRDDTVEVHNQPDEAGFRAPPFLWRQSLRGGPSSRRALLNSASTRSFKT